MCLKTLSDGVVNETIIRVQEFSRRLGTDKVNAGFGQRGQKEGRICNGFQGDCTLLVDSRLFYLCIDGLGFNVGALEHSLVLAFPLRESVNKKGPARILRWHAMIQYLDKAEVSYVIEFARCDPAATVFSSVAKEDHLTI